MEQITELKCDSCSSREFTREGDYLICDYCGTKFYSPKPKPQQAPKAQPQVQQTYTPTSTATKKKRRKLPLILVIIFAFLFMGTCAAIFEDELDDSSRVYVNVKAGETAQLPGYAVTVGTQAQTVILPGSYAKNVYVKFPVTIAATDTCNISRKNFSMTDKSYPEDAVPEELELKSGDTWQGFVYVDWYYADDDRDNESGLSKGHFGRSVHYYDRPKNASAYWEVTFPEADSVEVNATTVFAQLPNAAIRLTATYKESFLEAEHPEAVFSMANGDLPIPVVVDVDTQFKTQLEQVKPGDTVILRGKLNALQARVAHSTVVDEVVLTNASIVK